MVSVQDGHAVLDQISDDNVEQIARVIGNDMVHHRMPVIFRKHISEYA